MIILIVDDSAVMRDILIRSLRQEGLGHHKIVQACDGKEALALIRSHSPDIVISDWMMPNMTGIELLTELRDQDNQIPFGFVTAKSTKTPFHQAVEAGAQFFLSKPFEPKELAEEIEKCL